MIVYIARFVAMGIHMPLTNHLSQSQSVQSASNSRTANIWCLRNKFVVFLIVFSQFLIKKKYVEIEWPYCCSWIISFHFKNIRKRCVKLNHLMWNWVKILKNHLKFNRRGANTAVWLTYMVCCVFSMHRWWRSTTVQNPIWRKYQSNDCNEMLDQRVLESACQTGKSSDYCHMNRTL